MAAATQLGALLLDALGEFERAVEAVPAPGRHRRIGRLNAPAWTVAHLASSVDGWVNVYAWGGEGDRWAGEWYERQAALSAGVALDTSLDDARAAFARIAERARASLGAADAARLRKDTVAPLGRWGLQPVAYLVARASAHLFAHAGELTVAASLVGAPDLGLPGRLAGVRDTPADETARYVARLAVDARHEIGRVAQSLPAPARVRTIARLNAGARTLAHVAAAEDRFWNVAARGLPTDHELARAIATADAAGGDPAFDAAAEALARVRASTDDYLLALDGARFGEPLLGAAAQRRVCDQLARTAAHCFARAGELAAHGSLVGAPDPGLPGGLQGLADALLG